MVGPTSIAPPKLTAAKKPNRLADMVLMANGLNAARVFAAALVVLLHSAIPYMVSQVPVLWVLHDTSQHVSIDMLVFWVNGFVMPLFFLLAGLSIAKSARKKTFFTFASHRIRRLGATFLLASVLIIPPLLLCWAIGLLWTERLTMAHLMHLRFPKELHAYLGPAHLWFLEYLLLLCVGWAFIARIGNRWSLSSKIVNGTWAHAALGSVWGPLAFAVPTAIIFSIDIDTPFRLITPLVPDVARTLHYALFFVAGVWLAGMPQSVLKLRYHAPAHLVIAAVTFAGLGPLTLGWLDNSLGLTGRWAFVGLQAIFAWSMVFGFLGAMMRWCSGRRESIRYANEASFWIYLAHFPIVCGMQLVVWPWQIDPWAKLAIVATTGLVVSLMAYEFGVRYSWLGAVINGTRKHHESARGWRLEAGWMGAAAVGLLLISGFLWTGWDSLSDQGLNTVVDGQIYRSNRLHSNDLQNIITRHKIGSVINLYARGPQDKHPQAQQAWCDAHKIAYTTFALDEFSVPSSTDLKRLQTALKNSARPVLIMGGKRSPTLSGFGSAVALLMDDASPAVAFEQLSMRHFQLETAEHCIVARPLREYRDWLLAHDKTHTAKQFCEWTAQIQSTPAELSAAKQQQPAWQAMMGAPRYPRRF